MTNTTRAGDSPGRPEAVITWDAAGTGNPDADLRIPTNAGVRDWAPVGGRSTPSRAALRTRRVGTRTGTERGEPHGPRRAGRARGGKAGPQRTVVVTNRAPSLTRTRSADPSLTRTRSADPRNNDRGRSRH